MEIEWQPPEIRKHGNIKEVWYKNPNKDEYLVIRKTMDNYYEGEYYHTQITTWKWTGKTHKEVLTNAINDIESGRIINMNCKKCNSLLINLYFRDNQQNKRSWIKTKYKYCKNCKKVNY